MPWFDNLGRSAYGDPVMVGPGLYAAGMASGLGAYAVGRWVLGLRDVHRAAMRAEHDELVARLLDPYTIDLVAAEDAETRAQRATPALVSTSAGTPTSRNAAQLMPLRSE